jgi:pimeloyl-ACP methyl ester carboxylesterase
MFSIGRISNGCEMTYSSPVLTPLETRINTQDTERGKRILHAIGVMFDAVEGVVPDTSVSEVEFEHQKANETVSPSPSATSSTTPVAVESLFAYKYRLLHVSDAQLPASACGAAGKGQRYPVLFVPGHRGSARQARSLANTLYRMTDRVVVYSTDLGEEASALSSPLLWEQAAFLGEAIAAISHHMASCGWLAPAPIHNTTQGGAHSLAWLPVTVVAHSMGGIVARMAIIRQADNVLASLVEDAMYHRESSTRLPAPVMTNIITLGTPHAAPPADLDPGLHDIYAWLEQEWAVAHEPDVALNTTWQVRANGFIRNALAGSFARESVAYQRQEVSNLRRLWLQHVSVVSITSGDADFQVWSPHGVLSASAVPWVALSSVDLTSVRLTIDHLAILWCKQLITAVSTAIVQVVHTHSDAVLHRSAHECAIDAFFCFKLHLTCRHGVAREGVTGKPG